jgi:hypothetical protein
VLIGGLDLDATPAIVALPLLLVGAGIGALGLPARGHHGVGAA